MLGIEPYFDQPFYVGFEAGGYELGLDPDGAPVGLIENAHFAVREPANAGNGPGR